MVKILFFYVFCYMFSFKQNYRKEKKSFIGAGGASHTPKNPPLQIPLKIEATRCGDPCDDLDCALIG